MRRRPISGPALLLVMALGFEAACGKRADPLAPYVKTPQVPTGLEVSQIGEEIEIRVTAPRTTTENRPLPVIELAWFQAPATGDFGKVAVSILREEAAPSEIRTKRFPRPVAETRYSVRAFSGKAQSAPAAPFLFKPAPVPAAPLGVHAINVAAGVELRWTNPPGAEPWPSPPVSPTPTPTPSAGAAASVAGQPPALPPPSPQPTTLNVPPAVPPSPQTPQTVPSSGSLLPTATPSPSVVPTPPTGIRVFRTDGTPRQAASSLQASSWVDVLPKPGETPCYSLRYAASFKPLVESAPTEPVCVEIKDIVPPDAPARLLGDIGATFVELSWLPSIAPYVAFYRIYRTFDGRPRAVAIETQGPVLRVRDPNLSSGPRTYEIVAVDKGGNESVPGPLLKIIVP